MASRFIIPQLIFFVFPLVTCRWAPFARIHLPSIKRVIIEATIAVPIVIGCLFMLAFVQFVTTQLSPGATITPEVYDRMSRTPVTSLTYGLLLASILSAPVTEEVFFRGFLYNAFRNRMPLVIAMILQSVIFGFAHSYGVVPAIAAAFLGIVLTLVYHWRQTIITSIFVHSGYNALAVGSLIFAMHAHANGPVLGVLPAESTTKCVIGTVVPDSPAIEAGLLPGDTITQFGKYSIEDFQDLFNAISYYEVGDIVVVVVNRQGETMEVFVDLASRSSLSSP